MVKTQSGTLIGQVQYIVMVGTIWTFQGRVLHNTVVPYAGVCACACVCVCMCVCTSVQVCSRCTISQLRQYEEIDSNFDFSFLLSSSSVRG